MYAQKFDRDYVVVLSDWTDTNPDEIVSNLKFQNDYYNFHHRESGTFFADARKNGLGATLKDRAIWGKMRMSATDISDVTGSTYTYLLNGHAPRGNWTGLFKPGKRVRLRFINAGSMTFFDVRIPGLKMTVVAADGQDVEPVAVDEFRMGAAQTYDVIVEPTAEAYTIFAQSEDRTGFARGTVACKVNKRTSSMIIRAAFVAIITGLSGGVALAQSTAASPSSDQTMQGMGNMPGMGSNSTADMNTMMKHCAQMRAQMKAGMKMTPDMQPMMDKCDKMDRSMGAAKAPDDTLSR